MSALGKHAVTAIVAVVATLLLVRPGGVLVTQEVPRAAARPPQPGIPPKAQPGASRLKSEASVPVPVPVPAPLPGAAPSPAAPAAAVKSKPRLDDETNNIEVYEKVNRGVVNITTAERGMGLFSDEAETGSGSGFVIDERGHILTNFHVIEGAEALQVTFHDGSTFEGEVVGVDPSNDVAVLKVAAPGDLLEPVALGDSSDLKVGQKVLAVGNPFGLDQTLTTGIISALDRSMRARNGRSIKGIVQTDAAINPGNSGGPLLDSRGEVIGLTTAIISQVGQSAGIGFAVPINSITRILNQLLEHGRVIRAELGLRRVLVTEEGLLVLDVVEGGPADQAGILQMQERIQRFGPYQIRRPDPRTADLIVAVDGKQVENVDELLSRVEEHAPGETCTITLLRRGETLNLEVILGESQ